jgi:hypothetical protein
LLVHQAEPQVDNPSIDQIEHAHRPTAAQLPNQMTCLGDNRFACHQRWREFAEQIACPLVMLVARIEQCNQRTRVDREPIHFPKSFR